MGNLRLSPAQPRPDHVGHGRLPTSLSCRDAAALGQLGITPSHVNISTMTRLSDASVPVLFNSVEVAPAPIEIATEQPQCPVQDEGTEESLSQEVSIQSQDTGRKKAVEIDMGQW